MQSFEKYLMHDGDPVHPTVRTVSICYKKLASNEPYSLFATSYNLVLERRLIRKFFARAFPNAMIISFCKQIEWRRSGRSWMPVIVCPESVKQSLVRMSEEKILYPVRDYAGCLGGLFEKEELTHNLRVILNTFEALQSDDEENMNIP